MLVSFLHIKYPKWIGHPGFPGCEGSSLIFVTDWSAWARNISIDSYISGWMSVCTHLKKRNSKGKFIGAKNIQKTLKKMLISTLIKYIFILSKLQKITRGISWGRGLNYNIRKPLGTVDSWGVWMPKQGDWWIGMWLEHHPFYLLICAPNWLTNSESYSLF